MNFDEYQAIEAINFSTLKSMRESPLHYLHTSTATREETAAMFLGSAVHCAVLEPDRFAAEYVSTPEEPDFGDCRNKTNKAARDQWREQSATKNAGKKVISATDLDRLREIRDRVFAHPDARDLLSHGKAEHTIQWVDPYTKLACKGRLDWLREDCIVGLKTTKSNNFRSFQRSVEDYGYLLQWAWYQFGAALDLSLKLRRATMFEICVESTAPHDVVVYRVPQELIDDAVEENRELLARVAECKKSGIWPGRAPGIVEFHRAAWAVREQEDEIDLEGCAT